ncbi:MAG: hypothetical protein U9R66_01105 [Thermodesulfobacteriota bacterium]|nr:hypothetical protein [Thermodesulfobacteriota bacterium]
MLINDMRAAEEENKQLETLAQQKNNSLARFDKEQADIKKEKPFSNVQIMQKGTILDCRASSVDQVWL